MDRRTISRRRFLETGAAGLGGIAMGCSRFDMAQVDSMRRKPNIVLIFSDQQHGFALGCLDPFFQTPNLDRLARDGVLFEKSFCTTPQCSPSRSSLLTGLYPSKTGVMGNVGALGGKPLAIPTIAGLLQDAGYRTGYFGKWHLGSRPLATAGWDESIGMGPGEPLNDSLAQERAIEFIRNGDEGKPFALFVSINNPHDIYQFPKHDFGPKAESIPLPESWRLETFAKKPLPQKQFMAEDQGKAIAGKPKVEWERYRDCYRMKIALYDDNAGAILEAVKQKGLWDETIVVATSDHGDMDTNHRLIFKGPFLYEHMIRVPLIVRVPEQFGGTRPQRLRDLDIVNVDLFPTLCEFAGIDPPETDGISLKPILTGSPEKQRRRDFVIAQYYSKQKWVNPIRMIRTSEFKYTRYIEFGEELYDLRNDPDELTNLAGQPDYAALKNDLSRKLDCWIEDNDDPFYSFLPTDRTGKPLK